MVFYVAATAGAIILLALSWQDEVDRRHAAQAAAASSLTALKAAQDKAGVAEARDRALTGRVELLTRRLEIARREASRRTGAVRSTSAVLRSTRDFIAGLKGLDETLKDVVGAESDLETAKARLAMHLDRLSVYLAKTKEDALDRSVLRARTMSLVGDLATIRAIVADLAAAREILDKVGEPLGNTDELDVAIKTILARARASLRR
jgi:hypothetical protein